MHAELTVLQTMHQVNYPQTQAQGPTEADAGDDNMDIDIVDTDMWGANTTNAWNANAADTWGAMLPTPLILPML